MDAIVEPGPAAVTDERERIRLTLPDGPRFATVARIVVGGLAARQNLSYEDLDDLQLAVETVLAGHIDADGPVTLELTVWEGSVVAELGPIEPGAADGALTGDDGELGLQVVLSAVVDEIAFRERDGASWLRLAKNVHPLPKA